MLAYRCGAVCALVAFCMTLACPGLAQNPPANPQETTPLPPATTQERLVNPVGLSEPPRYGWHTDFIGPLRGDFDLSFGIKFWPERFSFRSLILSGTTDLLPGVRARAQLRRHEGERKFFQVDIDELYLEAYNRYRAPTWNAGVSLRLGNVRYLHFPYPDAIAQFDLPTPITDLSRPADTVYRSLVLQAEAALNSGWGYHFSGLAQGVVGDARAGTRVLESYGFYRSDFGRGWHFEGRGGVLAVRNPLIGRGGELGGSVYVGKQIGEFNVGLLYENKRNENEYSGIMVQFRPGPVTRALGKVMFDYSRRPEGFTAQIPLWHGRLRQSRFVRPGDVLVGEVRAVRIRTVFQQGVPRNQYEHRLASWGETSDPRLHCVVTEEPWYLQAEALVSRHLVPDARWERDRMGPGQFVQRVTYRFYRQGEGRP